MFGDYDVPAGMAVISSIYGTHHNPKYNEKANEFDPKHFIDKAAPKRHSFTRFLFIAGE